MRDHPDDAASLGPAASCVGYELGALMLSRTLLKVARDPVYTTLLLEGFLLHVRNLVEFLCPRPSARNTDIQAHHFVPAWKSVSKGLTFAGVSPKALLDRIDKTLSHMTIFRIGGNTSWPVAALNDDVIGGLRLFLDLASPGTRARFEPHVLERFGYAPSGEPR